MLGNTHHDRAKNRNRIIGTQRNMEMTSFMPSIKLTRAERDSQLKHTPIIYDAPNHYIHRQVEKLGGSDSMISVGDHIPVEIARNLLPNQVKDFISGKEELIAKQVDFKESKALQNCEECDGLKESISAMIDSKKARLLAALEKESIDYVSKIESATKLVDLLASKISETVGLD